MRDGFYYFSPAGTPFYPGVHNLGSRIWVSDDRGAEPDLGEWSGAQQFYRGDPPARLPLPVVVGDGACIEGGERPGLPIIPNRSAFCGRILPDACYLAEDELLAKTNVLDCQFAKFTADVISKAYTNLAAAEAIVATYLGPLATVSSFPQPNPLIPAGVIAVQGNTAVLWLTGTSDFNQLAVQSLYFGTGPVNQGLYSVSAFYEAAAFAIADALTAAGAFGALRIVLTGHSYGGAVCVVLAAKIRIANPARTVEMLTIGAPQAGDQRLVDLVEPLRQMHYANERDPIPFLPPRGLTFAAFIPFIGPALALLWPKFARLPNVRTVTIDGRFIDERIADLPDDLISTAVLAIAAAVTVPRFTAHKADWYGYYLCLACPCVPRPCVEPQRDIGFRLGLKNFSYRFEGVDVANFCYPPLPAPAILYALNGLPIVWQVTFPNHFTFTMEAFLDAAGEYSTFRLTMDPVPVSPVWACFWELTHNQVFNTTFTLAHPTHFETPFPGDAWFGNFELDYPHNFV